MYRDFATLREVSLRFDTLGPDDVARRLQPLAVPGGAWFGPAGELLGLAYVKQGKKDLAGPLFGAIAKDKDAPESLRARARQMAGLLGNDTVEDVTHLPPAQADAPAPAAAPAPQQ